MHRFVNRLFITAATVSLAAAPPAAQKPETAAGKVAKIDACSLLTKEEIKQYLPWPSFVDRLAGESEDIRESGSACNYPTVYIQLFPYSRSFMDAVHKSRKQEPVAGLGDEAYISANRTRYAELVVKMGARILTLQANVPREGTYESTKPKTIALAKALIAKLPAR